MRRFRVLFLAASLSTPATVAAWGQYPPQGYPPAGTPPGRSQGNPPIGPGNPGEVTPPLPSRKGKTKKKKEKDDRPIISAEGRTLLNDGKKLVVKVDDGRTLTMAIESETKWTRAGADMDASKVVPRSVVKVDAAEEDNFDLTATHVDLLKDPPVQAPSPAQPQGAHTTANAAGASTPNDDDLLTRPTILHGPEDANRPVLRHEKAPRPRSQSEDTGTVAVSSTKKPADSDMDFTIEADTKGPAKRSVGSELLDRTTEWTENFMDKLPNYVCEQNTTRYAEHSRAEDWQAEDVISAQVIYEDGQDKYRNIMINNKKTNKSMMELGGQTSTGEFGSVLISLFHPLRNTEFTYARATMLGDTPVVIYDYKVALANSDWHIFVGGQLLEPAYSGRIWVEKKSGEIRRLEQRADNVPKDFPNDTVEMAIDYEEVTLGSPTKYLVPVHAENISCQRGTQFCGKNVIEFRNYHRYAGESTITFP